MSKNLYKQIANVFNLANLTPTQRYVFILASVGKQLSANPAKLERYLETKDDTNLCEEMVFLLKNNFIKIKRDKNDLPYIEINPTHYKTFKEPFSLEKIINNSCNIHTKVDDIITTLKKEVS